MGKRLTTPQGLELHYGTDERGSSWSTHSWVGGSRRVQVCFRYGEDFRFEGSFVVEPDLDRPAHLVSNAWGAAYYDPSSDEVEFYYRDGDCWFCEAHDFGAVESHEPSCVWRRAVEWVSTQEDT